MPYRLTWEPEGLLRRYGGDVSIAERRAAFDTICGDPRFDGLRYVITDYLDVAGYEDTPDAALEAAALHIGAFLTNPRIVVAAVATRPDIVASIARFIGHGFTPNPYHVFASERAARRWIEDLLAEPGVPAAGSSDPHGSAGSLHASEQPPGRTGAARPPRRFKAPGRAGSP